MNFKGDRLRFLLGLERSGGAGWQRALIPLGLLLSVGAHALLAAGDARGFAETAEEVDV